MLTQAQINAAAQKYTPEQLATLASQIKEAQRLAVGGNGTKQTVQRKGDIDKIQPQLITHTEPSQDVQYGYTYPAIDNSKQPYGGIYKFNIPAVQLNPLGGLLTAGYWIVGGNWQLQLAALTDLVAKGQITAASIGLPMGITAGSQSVFTGINTGALLMGGYSSIMQYKPYRIKMGTDAATGFQNYSVLMYRWQVGNPSIVEQTPLDSEVDAYQFQSQVLDLEMQDINFALNTTFIVLIPGLGLVASVPNTLFSIYTQLPAGKSA